MRLLLTLFMFCGTVFAQDNYNNVSVEEYQKLLNQIQNMQNFQSSQDVDIRVERSTGIVYVIPNGNDEERIELSDNYQYPLEDGDVIETGYNGSAVVYINDAGSIFINRNSKFEVTSVSKDMEFDLSLGSVVAKFEKLVKKGFSSLKVYTPNAVCGIRGTEFAVEYNKFNNESNFAVFDEGEIEVSPSRKWDSSNLIKIPKNSELSFNPKSRNYRIKRLYKMSKYKRYIVSVRKKLIAYRKKWKRFSPKQKRMFRQNLFKKRMLKKGLDKKKTIRNIKEKIKNRKPVKKEMMRMELEQRKINHKVKSKSGLRR